MLGLTDKILAEDLPDTLLEEQSAGLVAGRYHNTLSQTRKRLVLAALKKPTAITSRPLASLEFTPNLAPVGPESEFEVRRKETGVILSLQCNDRPPKHTIEYGVAYWFPSQGEKARTKIKNIGGGWVRRGNTLRMI